MKRRVSPGDDAIGKRFGLLTVVSVEYRDSGHWAECLCDCGGSGRFPLHTLRYGHSKSCGCAAKNRRATRLTWHPLYMVWRTMIRRCYDPKMPQYRNYGARGITVCPEWRDGPDAFYRDMGERPEGYSLDRIDNDGPYSPSNCRWASEVAQHRNRSDNVLLTAYGETKTIGEWVAVTGIPKTTLWNRYRRGYAPERILARSNFRHNPPKPM